MSLLDRYVTREILPPFAGALLFLTQILIATQLVAQADVIFGSGVSTREVLRLALDFVPHFVDNVLPAAFLLGAVLGVGRLSEDREILALAGAGISPLRVARAPVLIAAALSGAALWMGFVAEPLALRDAHRRLDAVIKKNLVAGVRPGVFYGDFPGLTLYVEDVSGSGWRNVLLSDTSDPGASVLLLSGAGALRPEVDGGRLGLVLGKGTMHREESERYVAARFDRLTAPINVRWALESRNRLVGSPWELGLGELRRLAARRPDVEPQESRRWAGFLHRRVASAVAVVPFALIAVAVAASRRTGRALAISAALAAVIVHYLLLRLGETMARAGTLPAALALETPNVVLAAAGIAALLVLDRRNAGAVR